MKLMRTRSWSLTTEESAIGSYSRGGLVGLGTVWTLWSRKNLLSLPVGEKQYLEILNKNF
jgi:hypothetical protein